MNILIRIIKLYKLKQAKRQETPQISIIFKDRGHSLKEEGFKRFESGIHTVVVKEYKKE